MNRLMLSVIRFSKIMEIIFMGFLMVGLWIVVGLYISDMTAYYKSYMFLWLFYIAMVLANIWHFCFNNTFYNLRLAVKAHGDFGCGKCIFDVINNMMCGPICAKAFCKDFRGSG